MGTVSEGQMGGSLWLLVGTVAQCHGSGCLKVVNSGGFNAMQVNKPVVAGFPLKRHGLQAFLFWLVDGKDPVSWWLCSSLVNVLENLNSLEVWPRAIAGAATTAPSSEVWPTSDCILEPQPKQNWRPLWYCPHRGVCEWVPSLG